MSVDDYFRHQYGLITRDQARSLGLTFHQVDHRIATGRWERVHRGVYLVAAVPATWESRLLAAVLASGGVASHRCAATLWRLDPFFGPDTEITVVHGSPARLDGVLVHQSRQWSQRDECIKRGIACTGIERAILDSGSVVSVKTLELVAMARRFLFGVPAASPDLRARRSRPGGHVAGDPDGGRPSWRST